MKRILSVFLVSMVLLIFYGTAMANGGAADKTDTKQVVTSSHDKEPAAPIKTLAQIDKHKHVQCFPHHRPPRYCTHVLSYFCEELCGDVSPSRGGGSHHWGRRCTPGLERKCDRCGFLE